MFNSDWSVNITLVDIEANCCAATLGTCVCVCVCTCFFFVPPDFTKYDLWKEVCSEGEDGICS
jgi:hypothetical protein